MFRSGKWCIQRPRNGHGLCGEDGELLLSSWESRAVVPLGGGLLCWVNGQRSVLISDVFEEKPTLRHVRYPDDYWYGYLCIAAGGTVKLLNTSAGYCSRRGCSDHVYAVHSWTLQTDGTAWAMDNTADDSAAEPWALTICCSSGYARVQLVYPVVSTNETTQLPS
ncbi:hypothetical protein C2845_PM15G04610 [Panicum miliaceum]|uniref:Uncharacterized protein n=1 Tax=Panicum miliaceum TaxID=4540 RepID=A0A3L6Q993_PANMI|nr:hypothetical protein C2845_PM15G04610 [Panicum miliaceum]